MKKEYPETVSSRYVVDAVRRALPGTRIDLAARVFRGEKAVGRALRYLVAIGDARVIQYQRGKGRYTAVYGAEFDGQSPATKPRGKTGAERMKDYRDRCKQDGSWEDLMAKDRLKRRARRPARRDPAAVALFGLPTAGKT